MMSIFSGRTVGLAVSCLGALLASGCMTGFTFDPASTEPPMGIANQGDMVVEVEVDQSLPQPGQVFDTEGFSCPEEEYLAVIRENGGQLETQVYDCSGGTCQEETLFQGLSGVDCECSAAGTATCAGIRNDAGVRTVVVFSKGKDDETWTEAVLGGGSSVDLDTIGDLTGLCSYQPVGRGQVTCCELENGVWGSCDSWSPEQPLGVMWDAALGARHFRGTRLPGGMLLLNWDQIFTGQSRESATLLDADMQPVGNTVEVLRSLQPDQNNRATPTECVHALAYVDGSLVVSGNPAGGSPGQGLAPEFPALVICASHDGLTREVNLCEILVGTEGILDCQCDAIDKFKERFADRPSLDLAVAGVCLGGVSISALGGIPLVGGQTCPEDSTRSAQVITYSDTDGSTRVVVRESSIGAASGLQNSASNFKLPLRLLGGISGERVQTVDLPKLTMKVAATSSDSGLMSANLPLQQGQTIQIVSVSLFHRVAFPQFGDGSGFFSQITISNPDPEQSAAAEISIRGQNGQPLTFTVNGEQMTVPGTNATGRMAIQIPPLGRRTFQTDGQGQVVVGSVVVESNRSVSGVVLFGGPFGLAGVGAVPTIPEGFTAPVEVVGLSVNTGIAVTSLADRTVRLSAELLGPDSAVLATATPIDLGPQGQTSLFVTQFNWSAAVDFSNFRGTLRVVGDGPIGAVAIQTRPAQFATLPVSPI